MRFITNIHNFRNFQRFSKVLKKFSLILGDNAHLTKSLLKKSPSRRFSFCQQHIKLEQFSQQNTDCRTAFLQNSSLGAPILIGEVQWFYWTQELLVPVDITRIMDLEVLLSSSQVTETTHFCRIKGCGGAGWPPPIILERLKLPQQIIYRRKENLSESPNHQKYWENILVLRFYKQFSRNRRNLGHFRKFEKISNS